MSNSAQNLPFQQRNLGEVEHTSSMSTKVYIMAQYRPQLQAKAIFESFFFSFGWSYSICRKYDLTNK